VPRKPRTKAGPKTAGKEKLLHGFQKDLVRLPRRGGFLAFLAAAILIGAGAGMRVLLDDIAGAQLPPFITFYPLLGLIGFLCGARIGIAAAVATMLLVWFYWMAPVESFAVPDRFTAIVIAVFLALGSLTAWIGAWARGLFDKVQTAQREHDRAARETVHRLKNLIAVAQGLSHQAAHRAATVEEYRKDLDTRLIALGQLQNLLLNGGESNLGVAKLMEALTSPFRDSPHFEAPQLETVGGGDFPVPQSIHLGLTLALGELGTNSLKYGALAGKGGKVRLTWRETDGSRIILWREDATLASDRQGFGSRLIASALDRLDGAKVEYTTAENGIYCKFEWPRG
jgi:two-component sensor histidine kinase